LLSDIGICDQISALLLRELQLIQLDLQMIRQKILKNIRGSSKI